MNAGLWRGVTAYVVWGLIPVYWKQMDTVPSDQLICHRIVWSFVTLAVVLAATAEWPVVRSSITRPGVLKIYAVAAVLITVNWFGYVWGVNHGFIVEASLGYFITPLVNVVLGVVFFNERLRALQWMAIALAAAGVVHLTYAYGSVPWIAIVLALSFGGYGAAKKQAPLASMQGLTIETAILLVPAALYLLYADRTGNGAFLHQPAAVNLMLLGSGIVTTLPLLLFASALKDVPLSTMGVVQYVSPTLQLLIGVLVYREPFTSPQLIGFGIVWTGLAVFVVDGLFVRWAGERSMPPVLEDL